MMELTTTMGQLVPQDRPRYVPMSQWVSTLVISLNTPHPSDPPSQAPSYCLAAEGTDVEKLWNNCDCSEDEQNKTVLGEVSISLTYCALEQMKLNTTEDCALYPLFFMTGTHLEVYTESSNSERIRSSLAAVGWTTARPCSNQFRVL